MSEDYVSICNLCKNPVSKADLEYLNGTSYHTDCLKNADDIVKPDQNTLDKINMIRLDIIKLRNLLVRGSKSNASKRSRKPTSKKTSKTRKMLKKAKTRKPVRRTVSKARTTRRKVKSRKPVKRTVSKARTTRRKSQTSGQRTGRKASLQTKKQISFKVSKKIL